MKVKLFTHTDLDGVGAAILAKAVYGNDVDIEYCDYDNINEKLIEFINNEEYTKFTRIYITDISFNEEVGEQLDIINSKNTKILMVDHHRTAKWISEKYKWATVVEEIDNEKTCGTYLFHILLIGENRTNMKILKRFEDFVEKVRRYDTWEWTTKYNDIIPKQLNDILQILGIERFVEKYLNFFKKYKKVWFDKTDSLLLTLRQEEINRHIDKKEEQIIVKEIQNYKVGIVFGDRFRSELGNSLARKHPELDFIAIIDPSTHVSLRTIKEDIDLGLIAKEFGGGGHPKAAGFTIDYSLKEDIIKTIFRL